MIRIGALLFLMTVQAPVGDVAGRWTLELDPNLGGVHETLACMLKQDGRALALDCGGAEMSGTVDGRNVTFTLRTGAQKELTVTFTGTLNQTETAVEGTWRLPSNPGGQDTGRFALRK